MAKMNGSLIVLSIDGDKIIGLTSNNLDFTADEIETTAKDSTGRWKEFIQGEKGGTIAFEARYDDQEGAGELNFGKLFAAFNTGAAFDVIFGESGAGNSVISAEGFLTAISWAAPQNEAAGVTGTIRLTGPAAIVVTT
jgi:predicted secreted protein